LSQLRRPFWWIREPVRPTSIGGSRLRAGNGAVFPLVVRAPESQQYPV
jgi:hypothetical protein